MKVIIPTRKLTFTMGELTSWIEGDREYCTDSYCRRLPGSRGFGEYIAGKYYEDLGYEWIHHDFNLFGGNKLGKYPRAEEVLRKHLGDERYEKGRGYTPAFYNFVKIEEPDLMVYKPDFSGIRFIECKRQDTNDKLRDQQIKGLALIKLLFDCPIEVVEILDEGRAQVGVGQPLSWEF